MNRIICGVDVSKDWLDAQIRPGAVFQRFANDASGIAALSALCEEQGATLVVMEASGGYERAAFLLLWEMGMPCALANARSVRYFAEAMGFLEKTDRIDAGVIAHYAEVKKLCATPAPDACQLRLCPAGHLPHKGGEDSRLSLGSPSSIGALTRRSLRGQKRAGSASLLPLVQGNRI